MEFCSKYGYDYGFEGSEDESVSDIENDLSDLSVNSASSRSSGIIQSKLSNVKPKNKEKKIKLKKVRKADSNIISVKFDQLVMTNEMFAGDPIKCKNCEAIMSEVSNQSIDKNKKTWKCEFCFTENDISKLDSFDQIPKVNDVTFLIEPAVQKTEQNNKSQENASNIVSSDNNYLIYCIDISGSMDTQIPIKANDTGNLENYSRGMNRLEGVKIACIENINRLKNQEPNKRVGLVTFSDTVSYFGDASSKMIKKPILFYNNSNQFNNNYTRPVQRTRNVASNTSFFGSIKSRITSALTSKKTNQSQTQTNKIESESEEETENYQSPIEDIMNNKEKMIALAENQDGNLRSISESCNSLEQKIKALHTEGSTALGPALAFSVGFTSRQPGSQIILCTDGCANVGMGSINYSSEGTAEKFYDELADYAKSKGIVVNIISMEGTDCKLALLGKVADKTNGTMNIVNPLNLSDEFKSILENRIVATEVKAKLIVNKKYLYVRDEDLEAAEAKAYESNDPNAKLELDKMKKSILVKDIGNANIDTEITLEYGVRKLNENEKKEATPLKELPFQLQISYTLPDGAKALRVYTKIQEFTNDRKKAESSLVSKEAIWANYAQKMSSHVTNSNVGAAQYRGYQISKFNKNNNWATPNMLNENIDMINCMELSAQSSKMTDKQANFVYKAKKMNRSFFK